MGKNRKYKYFACDFETTVFEGQESTEVWASGLCELNTEDVKLFHSIDETFEYLVSLNSNLILYYHNLKFDGTFWINYLLEIKQFKQAYRKLGDSAFVVEWMEDREMPNNSIKYGISDRGQWYTITVKTKNKIFQFRDSLKLLPFSLKRIGKAFKTKHQKLDMEYEGYRYAGCTITDEEAEYLKNDVLVLKEALEFMFSQGHNKLTIGSCCLSEYKGIVGKLAWENIFPDLTTYTFTDKSFDAGTADAYIRHSYKGGWCYLVKGKENKIRHNGFTADVNSLYPSMMSSESGNYYPFGDPTFWKGDTIPDDAIGPDRYYFVRFTTRFYLKEGMLPFIQIKGNWLYKGTECLETSDIKDPKTGEYHRYYRDIHGEVKEAKVTLTLTCIDFKLFLEHYNVRDFKILDGCWFKARIGLFDDYINPYKELKMKSKGAMRELAKLFLNNLYGKMASNDDSSFKVAYLKDDNSLGFMPCEAHDKKAGYIPIGSAITSYARNFTIRAAQKNYYGSDKAGFIYADTDSIHCDLPPEKVKGITIDPVNFCCWKLESYWDEAIFVRQKTYIEHITHEDGDPIDNPYYNVKCAGMPEKCKDLFVKSMTGYEVKEGDKYDEEEKEFINTKRTLKDFKVGLKIKGKLMPKRIHGGTVLVEGYYEMRKI